MSRKCVRIRHAVSNSLIAEGPVGWAITPFEGSYYIRKKNLVTNRSRTQPLPWQVLAYRAFSPTIRVVFEPHG